MVEEDLLYTLALQKVKGVGDIVAKKLIEHCGSAKNIFLEKKETLSKINGVGSLLIKEFSNKNYINQAEKELAYIKKNKIAVSYFLNDDYPYNLKHCVDGPVLLFGKGNINLSTKRIISIVGTRKMTSYGKSVCKKLIEELQPYRPVIISGFAYGVDIFAHLTALQNNLQTVAVLAHGLNKMYPATHQKHISNVMKNGGFITDFWHEDAIRKENFLKRNRIIAGLSQATIIIESAAKGGSLVTADIANSYNREVFAVPGRTTDKYSIGCNNLIKNNGAMLLNSAKDLAEMLNWEPKQKTTKTIQKQLFVELTKEEEHIYNFMKNQKKQELDSIALYCKLPIHKTTAILFNLEMKGVVRPLPGKFFEII